jgi:hypothetical protein
LDVKCIAESGLKSPGTLGSEQQFVRGWRGEGMMNAGGVRVLVYFADGDGGGSAGRGAVGGGASGTVRLTARRRLHRINFRDLSKYKERDYSPHLSTCVQAATPQSAEKTVTVGSSLSETARTTPSG